MKIEQLKSGSYRVRITQDKKTYSLTFNHIPSEKEVYMSLAQKQSETAQQPHTQLNLHKATEEYIELKKDRNSPSTLREYQRLTNHFTSDFCNKPLDQITQLDLDKQISNWLKADLSYKTMKNYAKMFQAIVTKFGSKTYNLDMLPEKPKKEEPYIPTTDDVARLLDYFKKKNTNNLIPFWLSMFGLRRGEILAIDPAEDIDYENAVIHIRKDLVEDINHNWVIKEPKTQASKRDVAISHDLSDLIRITGKIYDGYPNSVNKALRRAQKQLGIESFSLHKMRHYCCSQLFDMGYTETDIMAYMGWEEESECMRHVYKHALIKKDKDKMRHLSDQLSARILTRP